MERKYRMYGLVPYNISPIQQGIQFGHAVVEYGNQYSGTPEYQRWSRIDKTFIILNGGTTNTNHLSLGSLNQHATALKMIYGIDTVEFYEPDLGDQLTAVVFLVDDRVWDREAYPDYAGTYVSIGWETKPMEPDYSQWMSRFSDDRSEAESIVELRKYLKQFKLA
jgi:hypothetical protein